LGLSVGVDLVESAFFGDAVLAVLAPGGGASRHGQARVWRGRGGLGDGCDGCGRCTEGGEQQSAAGVGGVGLAVGVCPDDGAVGVLSFVPAEHRPEGFEQVMKAAQAFEVRGARRPVGVGDGVVHIASGGRHVAAREAAGEVAAADEVG